MTSREHAAGIAIEFAWSKNLCCLDACGSTSERKSVLFITHCCPDFRKYILFSEIIYREILTAGKKSRVISKIYPKNIRIKFDQILPILFYRTQMSRTTERESCLESARGHWNTFQASLATGEKTIDQPGIYSSVITCSDPTKSTVFISIISPKENDCNESGKTLQAGMSFGSLEAAKTFAIGLLAQIENAQN